MFRFVINPRYIKLFVELEKRTLTVRALSKKLPMHYAHLTTVVGQFHREGIVETENVKNTLEVCLTAKGRAMAALLFKMNELVLNWKEPKGNKATGPRSEPAPAKAGIFDALTAALKKKNGGQNGTTAGDSNSKEEPRQA